MEPKGFFRLRVDGKVIRAFFDVTLDRFLPHLPCNAPPVVAAAHLPGVRKPSLSGSAWPMVASRLCQPSFSRPFTYQL